MDAADGQERQARGVACFAGQCGDPASLGVIGTISPTLNLVDHVER